MEIDRKRMEILYPTQLIFEQDSRLPPAYFPPSNFGKDPFKRIKAFFSKDDFIIFLKFSKVWFSFEFSPKKT